MIIRYVWKGNNRPELGGCCYEYTMYCLFGIIPLYIKGKPL